MPSHQDSAGRPIVVVTGMGVVTSLGAGKADNWKNLTAGKSGIKNITRFATDGLKTRFAGTVDFVIAEPQSCPELSERLADLAVEEAIAQSGIGSRGDFPGPLFLAVPPIEIEWEQRRKVAAASGANAGVNYNDLVRTAASGQFKPFHERFMFGSVADHLADKYRHQGLADLAVDRLRVGRDLDPARHRGDPPRRGRRRALHRHRRLDQSGIADPVFAVVGAVDVVRSARAGRQALRQEPRRLRHGRGRRRAGAGESGIGARRAAQKFSAS